MSGYTLTPEDATILCEIEERAALLVTRIESVKASIEFEALAAAAHVDQVDQVLAFSGQLDAVTCEYLAFQTLLRRFVARLRLQARP